MYRDKKAVGYKNKGGWTALMYASYYDHSDVVKLLLEANASVHLTNNARCNALMLAVMCGNESIVETLIKVSVTYHYYNYIFYIFVCFLHEDLFMNIYLFVFLQILEVFFFHFGFTKANSEDQYAQESI